MKYLFVNLNHIGDLLFTLPAADALLAAQPDAQIVHLVSQATLPLVQDDPRFSAVVPRSRSNVREWVSLARKLRRQHQFDAAINFCRTSAGLGLVTGLSGAPLRIGFSGAAEPLLFFNRRVPYEDTLHRVERNVSLLKPLGIDPFPAPPMRLHLPERIRHRGESRLEEHRTRPAPWVALCVGASVERKKWGLAHYVALAERLYHQQDMQFVLVGGKEDEADAARFLSEANVPAVSFCGQVGLMESAAILNACDLAIGGDTGPIQLAIAVDTPVVALFGATDPRRTGPFRARGELIFHRLACCGCRTAIPCPIGVRCMTDITVEEVSSAALRVLRSETLSFSAQPSA